MNEILESTGADLNRPVCNHRCEINYTTLNPNSSHYLDCPVWEALIAGSNLSKEN